MLVRASQVIDELFMLQVDDNNLNLLKMLGNREKDQPYLDYFRIMFGPWDRRDHNRPFIADVQKPPGAGYYPPDLTADSFEQWIADHPEDKASFESNFTLIRRKAEKLIAVPYHIAYKNRLKAIVDYLKQAAQLTRDLSLKAYLNSRAEAFLSDDYYQSDMDWMDLSGDLEVVIGPDEVYEDALLGLKAAFESFVCVVDHKENEKVKQMGQFMNQMEQHLP
ncbi:hypothetical protein BVY01_00100, partial [bacterium I07]